VYVAPFRLGLSPRVAAVRLSRGRGLCWLDGEAAHAEGRWSFLAVEPVERVERAIEQASPLSAFDAIEQEVAARAVKVDVHGLALGEVPRWAGFVAYDAAFAGELERRLPRAAGVPVLSFARYDAWLAFGHAGQGNWLIGDDEAAVERLLARLAEDDAREPRATVGALMGSDAARHRAAIGAALEHIAAGDFYQVNLARSFRAAFSGEPLALFLALQAASPVALAMYLDCGEQGWRRARWSASCVCRARRARW
jgi:para-aminobenzoate synthetase component 1